MKQHFLAPFLVILLGTSLFASTGQPDLFATQQRPLKNFSAVSLQIPAEVTLTKGDFAFRVSASQDALDRIVTEVRNGELIIRFSKSGFDQSSEPIKIELSMPQVLALEINGSGTMHSVSEFANSTLTLEINGSGVMSFTNMAAETLSATVNGSGRIENLKGTTEALSLQVNGNGEINIPDLRGKSVETSVTGSGKICTGATESLHAQIAGSGNIRYAGSPLKKNVEIIGSGTVTAMN